MLRRISRTVRGRNAVLNIFELWIGIAGFVSGVVFAYAPASIDHNALANEIGHSLAATYTVGYALSGCVIWYGLLRPSPKWEIVGLYVLGIATAADGISVLSTFGVRGTLSAVTLITLTFAAWVRAWFVQSATLRLAQEYQRGTG
jgi:hypothetical protein